MPQDTLPMDEHGTARPGGDGGLQAPVTGRVERARPLARPAPRLHFSTDAEPGIRRVRRGRGFAYVDVAGRAVSEPTVERIRSLAIRPAWKEVWILPSPSGHLQATGRDARGRKVYRYHADYRSEREAGKYGRLAEFGRVLPRVRRAVDGVLSRPGLPRDKVLALVIRLLELTHMRVGNEQYVSANRSFGLTTLRRRHARVTGSPVRFRFRGKSGRDHELRLRDRRLATLVRRCQDLPGQRLFEYLDAEGLPMGVSSDDVNDYLKRISGHGSHRPGLPDLGRHRARLPRAATAGSTRVSRQSGPPGRRSDGHGRDTLGQHPHRGARQLHPSCHPRRVAVRLPASTSRPARSP